MFFEQLYRVLSKSAVLEEGLKETEKMYDIAYKMFKNSLKALDTDDDALAKEVLSKDNVLDQMYVDIREDILRYLASTSGGDVNLALVLLNTAGQIEAIGDYCCHIADLTLNYPDVLKEDGYGPLFDEARELLEGMFQDTLKSLVKEDKVLAREVIHKYKKLKDLTYGVDQKINKDPEIKAKRAVRLATLTQFFRRIANHIKNIAETVVEPSPQTHL